MPDPTPPDERPEFWRSSNPKWGVVRAVATSGEFAIVLDDLNGDYREVELSVCRLVDGEWDDLLSLDDVGFPDEGDSRGGGWVLGSDGHCYTWLFGREEPGTKVALGFGPITLAVVADTRGMWLRVEQNDSMTTELRRLP